jgi:hypothetical protein
MPSVSEVRDQAIEVARGWSGPSAPVSWQLTAALFEAIAGDDTLLEAIASLPADRLPALLAGAAVGLLARRDTSAAINGYFPEPGGPQPRFDDGFFPAFRRFCSGRLDDIISVCRERRYQMNEVARCSQLVCGMAAAVEASEEPVALVDLGTGAGLALGLDRYHYRMGDRSLGPPDSPVRLSCDLQGLRIPPLSRLPVVAERVGIDLDPLDIDDEGSREWLEACTPPEEGALRRLTRAIEVMRGQPVRILGGDIVEVVPEVLERLPEGRHAVVVDAYTAVFLPEDRRAALRDALAEAGRARTISWLSLDPLVPLGPSGTDSVQDLPLPVELVEEYQQRGVFAVLGVRRFGGGTEQGRLLARSHPSGAWMEWLDELT